MKLPWTNDKRLRHAGDVMRSGPSEATPLPYELPFSMESAGRERLREALTPVRGYPVEGPGGHRRWVRDPIGAYIGFEDAIDVAAALAHDRPSGSVEGCTHPDEWRENWDSRPNTGWVNIATGWSTSGQVRCGLCGATLSGSSDPEAVGLDVERLALAVHEVLPEDDHTAISAKNDGEPYCEYIAAAIAGRYDEPDWPVHLTEAKPESPA